MSSSSNASVKKIRAGVIGATGFIGTPYRSELRDCEDVEIVSLCARREGLLAAAAGEDHASHTTSDWRETVHHPDVNYLLVCTPDALHHEAVMEIAQTGKHLFCEKPVGMNATQAKEMFDAISANSETAHFVPFWTRWSPAFVKARDIVSAGTLGTVRSVVYRWHNPRPKNMAYTWRDNPALSAAGSIADVGSHAYDTIRFITGLEADKVLTHATIITPSKLDQGEVNLAEALDPDSPSKQNAASRKGETPDYANISWQFQNGAVGALILSHAHYLRKGLVPELEIHGDNASLTVDRFHGKVVLAQSDDDITTVANVPPGGFDIGNRFKAYVLPALESVMGGTPQHSLDTPNLEDGWKVQLFTDAAFQSSQSGHWESISYH